MNDGLIPQRYAKALYKYALEKGTSAEIYAEMAAVASAFESEPKLQKVLANPFVSATDKEKLLISAAGDKAEDGYRSFVKLILSHGREAFARQMALAYRDIYRKANKIARVRLTTASRLPHDQLAKIRELVGKAFPDSTLEFEEKVDPELIGGFVVDVDSTRMDASLSSELAQLRQTLLRRN